MLQRQPKHLPLFTRTATAWHEEVLVKRRWLALVILLSTLSTGNNAANAGPFRDLFRSLRSAIAHPKETSRPRRSAHDRKKTSPDEASNSQTTDKPTTPASGSQTDVRWAKAASSASDQKADLQYGTPVPGKPGFVTSPFAPDAGYVQVLGFPPGTPVEDPYTGKIFLTP